ncbi:MAG: DMT family transporter [Silvibacterium sp.]
MNWRTASTFVMVGLLWGSAWIPSSFVLPQVPGLQAGALRFAIAAIFTRLLAPSRKETALVPSLVLGVTMVALPYALTVWATGQVSPGVVATLFASMPLAALLMSPEAASRAIPTLVIGIGGVATLVAQGLSTSTGQIKGVLLIGTAVALGAFSLNYAQRYLRPSDLLASVAVQFAAAAILLGALSVATERKVAIGWSEQTVFSLLILGVTVSGVTVPLVYWLLTKLEVWQVAALQWIATLIAVVEAACFLRAKSSVEMWAGAGMIVGATIWLLRGDGVGRQEAVTLQITNRTFDTATASESEVGSKVDLGSRSGG